MSDITMCQETLCPRNHKCKRFVAIPNEYWQSYFVPNKKPNERCKYFLEASSADKERYEKYILKGEDKNENERECRDTIKTD